MNRKSVLTNLHLIVVFLVAIAFSCKPEQQEGSINLTDENPISVWDVFSEVEVIQLEM